MKKVYYINVKIVYILPDNYSHLPAITVKYVNLSHDIHMFFAWITYHLNFFSIYIIIYGRVISMWHN